MFEQALDAAGGDIYTLDPALAARSRKVSAASGRKPTTVADVEGSVWANRRAIRTTVDLRHHFLAAVPATGNAPGAEFHDDDRAVGHGHRAFRKSETFRHDIHRHFFPYYGVLYRPPMVRLVRDRKPADSMGDDVNTLLCQPI